MSWRERLLGLQPLRRGQIDRGQIARDHVEATPNAPAASKDSVVVIVRAAIEEVDKSLPEGASLAERIAAIDAAFPFGKRGRNHKYRVWCRERRYYLRRFGFVSTAPRRCGPRYDERRGWKP